MAVTDMDVYLQDYSIPYLLQKLILGIRKKNAPYLVTRQYLIGLLRFSGLRGMPFMGKLLHSFSRVSRRKVVGFWMCSETNQIRTLLVSCAFHLWHLNMLRWSYYHFKIQCFLPQAYGLPSFYPLCAPHRTIVLLQPTNAKIKIDT